MAKENSMSNTYRKVHGYVKLQDRVFDEEQKLETYTERLRGIYSPAYDSTLNVT